ncbi:hypothetical protein PFISCL1PPCAC_16480 [Pristionchus fissidentatus]|uniref:F-box domain-containing protein n=1 Tax=Pristionchus fissidentatus TaxID=1538716 RepID=A0AAV5W415_9BILA|nr:hypothetical protein PFISCL1PPCAC_16480 [Pristionchus fissidentatus]
MYDSCLPLCFSFLHVPFNFPRHFLFYLHKTSLSLFVLSFQTSIASNMASNEETSPSKEEKFDMESLMPELLQLIIKHVGIKDRCNLRAFSSMEHAISQSHFDLSYMESSVIELQEIDFNRTTIKFIEDLLDGCTYDRISITVMTTKYYNESLYSFLKKQENKELEFTMLGLFIENEALLAIAPMRKLVIYFDFYQIKDEPGMEEPIWDDEIEMMLALVKKRHTLLEVSLADFRSDETIFDIFKVDYTLFPPVSQPGQLPGRRCISKSFKLES